MTAYSTQDTKNICIAGHGTTGKTILTESLLFNMNAIKRMGSIENGNSVSDFGEEEIEKGVSISASICSADHKGKMITFIDTPGFFDFSGEMVSTLSSAESVILTVQGTAGLCIGTENAYNLAQKYKKSISFFVNEIDKENFDVNQVIDGIESDLGIMLAPLTYPINTGPSTDSIIDILEGKLIRYKDGKRAGTEEIPSEFVEELSEIKTKLVETIAESDETLMEKYFEAGELTPDEMKNGLQKAFCEGKIYPIFFGTAPSNIGTDALLEGIVNYYPSPKDKGKLETPDGSIEFDEKAPFHGNIFKVCSIPQFGEMFFIKVLSGELKENIEIHNAESEASLKSGQLFFALGKERIRAESASAGQIIAAVKLKAVKAGDQLVSDKSQNPTEFPIMEWPKAIVRGAFYGPSKEDTDKIATGLKKIAIEDTTFKFRSDPELKQLIVDGLGRLHLETLALKLKNRLKLNVRIDEPRIPYRETIRGSADIRYRHKKQTGGAGQFGEVAIKLEPIDGDYEFVNGIVGGVVSQRFIPAVEKGLREVMVEGILVGCKIIGCKVTLYDGKEHSVDSNEMAFKLASSHAFRKAVLEAKPIILEPIYDVEITVPNDYSGTVMGDISGRRGQPLGMEAKGKYQILKAKIPLKELHDYSTQLRSMTNGRGTYSIAFSHYDPVPHDIQKQLVDVHKDANSQAGAA